MKKKRINDLITFTEPTWTLSNLNQDNEPSCFNGNVKVVRYKITVEEVVEPIEVIHERLQSLWDNTKNHHHHGPLLAAAKKHGYTFKGSMGNKVQR